MLLVIAVVLMLAFILTKRRFLGFLGWFLFGVYWLTNIPYYLSICDYYNTAIMVGAFILFTLIAYTILRTRRLEVLIGVTSFSALAAIFYFPFAMISWLKRAIIGAVVSQTFTLGHILGFDFVRLDFNRLGYKGKHVEIILACTGIQSMALFAGATLGIRAKWNRKIMAFLISVPVIYILNLFRDVFVLVAYGEMWFGEDSFYIAHNVISKVLATLALVLISLGVFKFLPELADLIYNLKDELMGVLHDRENGA